MANGNIVFPLISVFNGKGVEAAKKSFNEAGKAVRNMAAAFGVAKIASGSLKFISASVTEASSLQRNISGLKAVFGDASEEMIKFSQNAQSMGMSTADAAKASTFMGSMLKGAGLSMGETTEKTKTLVTLASDLAATFGYDVQEALTGIAAMFRGEYDPIEKFGVAIKQSQVNAEMAARGFKGLTGSAKSSAEQMVRYDLLIEKTADSQGQFAAQSGNMFVAQMKLQAAFQNMQANLGTALLPVLSTFASKLSDLTLVLMPSMQQTFVAIGDAVMQILPYVDDIGIKLGETFVIIANSIADIAPLIPGFLDLIMQYGGLVTGLVASFKLYAIVLPIVTGLTALYTAGAAAGTGVQWSLNAAMAANPAGLIAIAIVALTAAIAGLYFATQANKDTVNALNTEMLENGEATIGATEKMGGFSNMVYTNVNPALDAAKGKLDRVKLSTDAVTDSFERYATTLPYELRGPNAGPQAVADEPVAPSAPSGPSEADRLAARRKEQIKKVADTIAAALKDAKERVSKAASDFRNAASLADAVKERGDGSFVLRTGPMFRQMRKLIENAKDMAKNISKLKKRGADNELLQQIIDMGPGAGATAARELLQGGQIEEMMKLRSQLGTIGAAVGEAGNVAITGLSSAGWQSANTAAQNMVNSNNNTYNINLNKSNLSANDIIGYIRSYEKSTGKKVLVS